MKRFFLLLALWGFFLQKNSSLYAQGHISFQCKQLNISKSETLKCDAMSEDDPHDLAEAYGYLITYFPADFKGTDQRFELHFPTRNGNYHWEQSSEHDKNDSLQADFYYTSDGHELDAFPKDFTITITRYDAVKGGKVEGTFEGTMEAFTAWNHSNVSVSIKGNFQATRTGQGDECRKLRHSEKEVTDKAINIFNEVLVPPLQNMGWQIESKSNTEHLQAGDHPAPFRPLFLCSDFFDLKFVLDRNSQYGKMLNDSLEYYGKQSSQNSDDYKGIAGSVRNIARIRQMQQVEIKITENDPYLKAEHPMGKGDRFAILHVPGVPYACQIYNAPQNDLDPPDESTQLFFGNWAGADMNAKTYTGFPFAHKQSAPAIENIAVEIKGPASAANEIIKKIDWSKMNDALSK